MLNKSSLPVAIFLVYVAMLIMSIIAFWGQRPLAQNDDFAEGFAEGFATAATAGTLVDAVIFGVIAGLRRTRMTLVGATILVLFAACHLQRFVVTFPTLDDAAWSLAPHVARDVFLSPMRWVFYYIIYRAYRESRATAEASFSAPLPPLGD